ncbi:MAG: hypothetical protein ABH836_07595 [Candidatus Omnitrophota bacterium]
MKKEYDFSKGERGKFYNSKLELNIPVYLDSSAFKFVDKIAKRKNKDVSSVVNQIIHSDIKLVEFLK